MGQTAENIAAKYDISREAQDAFALGSQHKAGRCTEGAKRREGEKVAALHESSFRESKNLRGNGQRRSL